METDEYTLDIKTEKISLRDYLTREVEIASDELDYLDCLVDNQIFNLLIKHMDELIEYNHFSSWIDNLDLSGLMERFFVLVYEVDFNNNSRKDVSISYTSQGSIDWWTAGDPIYTFDHILNPTQNRESFQNLNIEIKPPAEHPYIVDSSVDLVRKEDGIYTGIFESLPEENLSFSLYYKEKITLIDKMKGSLNPESYLLREIGKALLGILLGNLIIRDYRRIKKPQES